jgi:hypothetical protein
MQLSLLVLAVAAGLATAVQLKEDNRQLVSSAESLRGVMVAARNHEACSSGYRCPGGCSLYNVKKKKEKKMCPSCDGGTCTVCNCNTAQTNCYSCTSSG